MFRRTGNSVAELAAFKSRIIADSQSLLGKICKSGKIVLGLRQCDLFSFEPPNTHAVPNEKMSGATLLLRYGAVDFLQSIFLLPYAFIWVPGGIFLIILGGACAFTQRTTGESSEPVAKAPPEESAPKQEKRTMFRRQGNPVELHLAFPEDKAAAIVASLLDRSVGGMRIACYDELPVGAIIVVRPVRAGEMAPWVELEVRSCSPSKEMSEQYEVGCQYVKVPAYSIQLLFG